MKRIAIILLTMLPMFALAGPFDVVMTQRNNLDTANLQRTVVHPTTTGVMGYNVDTQLPVYFTLGSGLTMTGGVLNSSSAAPSWASITGKPAFSTVATTGAYSDLSGLPSIPPAQVQADWNAVSAPAAILNKPLLFNGVYSSLTGIPATFAPSAHTQAWSTITATPTTLAGFGIADAVTSSALTTALGGYATTGALMSGLAAKFNTPTGNTAQYLRGDGSLATLPAPGAGTVTSITAGAGLSGGTITSSGAISLPNTGTPGTYGTVTTDAQGRITSGAARSFANPARSLNTAFQISTTQDAAVVYTVDISVTSLLLGGSSGRVFLEYADNAAMSTNLVAVNSSPNATGGVLNVTNLGGGNVSGWIPSGKWVRIRTANVTGAPTYTFQGSQEVLQ